jgi:hypothetical protein
MFCGDQNFGVLYYGFSRRWFEDISFWGMNQFSPSQVYWRFGGTPYLHLHVLRKSFYSTVKKRLVAKALDACSSCLSIA